MQNLLAVDIGKTFNSPFSSGGKTIGDLLSIIIRGSFVVAGIIILILLIIAGFSMIASAGSNNPEGAEKAKKALSSAAIGFVLIFGAYLIIRVIELVIGSNFITQPLI